jgi:hypothetical protein
MKNVSKYMPIFNPKAPGYSQSHVVNTLVTMPESPQTRCCIPRSTAMGLAKELTEREKRVILALRHKKMKLQEIADVANRHVSSVHRVVKAGITQKAPSKRGSKKKIGERTRRVIIRQAKLGSGGAKKLKAVLQLPAGVRTIPRYISQAPGMKFNKIRRGPMLLPRHRSARRIWSDEHAGLDDF